MTARSACDLDALTLAEAALWYAEHGIPVFPCRPRGKEPLVEGGFHAATTDEARIREWWRRWPEANIGVPTGAASGWLTVDVDPRNGGDSTVQDWIRRYGRWPDTAEAVTGGGGRHIVFRHVEGLRCGPLAAGVDLKSDGGYIIVAPSVHPTGGRYMWAGLAGAAALDHLAEPPDWLLRLVRERRPQRDPAPAAGVADEPIPKGRRNGALFKLASSLRARGVSQAGIEAALLAENQARCRPPLPDDEVRRIAESAGRYPAGGGNGGRASEGHPLRGGDPFVRTPGGVDSSRVPSPSAAIEVLNSLSIWKNLRWAHWRRRGDIFVGTTTNGCEIRIPGRKLGIFETVYSEILAETGVAILRPKRGLLRAVWGDIAELIHKASEADVVQVCRPEAELKHDLIRCYEMAGSPAPENSAELFHILASLRGYVRQPHEPTAPPCVFLWEGRWHVKFDILKLWISTPAAAASFRRLDELEQAACLLGFAPHPEQLSAQHQNTRVKLRTWSACQDVLSDD